MSRCRHLSLFWQIYLPIVVVILCAGSIRTGLLMGEERANQIEQLQATLEVTAETLRPLVARNAERRAYTDLHEQFRTLVWLHPDLARIEWRFRDRQLLAESPPSMAEYPTWFPRLVDLSGCSRHLPVRIADTDYGELDLVCDPTPALNDIWRRVVTQVRVIAAVIGVLFLVIAFALRASTASLRALTDAARRFRANETVRVSPKGAAELRELARTFNIMTTEIDSVLKALDGAHAQLSAEAELNRVTLLSISEGIIVTDAQNRVTLLNPVAETLTGWAANEARGLPVAEVFRIRNENNVQVDPVKQSPEDCGTAGIEHHSLLVRRNGSEVAIEECVSPIHNDDGEIIGQVLVFRDVSEKTRLQEEIGWQATHDSLTRLPNRLLLADRLQQAIAHADREERLLALAMIDLDGFKPVNDRLGHAAGDALLCEAARRMAEMLRATDTLARLGGDEFVLVLSDLTAMVETEHVFARLLERLRQPYRIEGEEVRISASLGYTLYPLLDESDPDTLLRHADEAMYAAKHAGRNRYHLFDAAFHQTHAARRRHLEAVRHALQQGQFELFYQPKVDMRRGHILGFEALARWRHPERGLLPPAEFLPYMEDQELASALGRFALGAALRQIAAWRALGLTWRVAVNIAPQHFTASGFLEDLEAALNACPEASPDQLELEIVESAAIEDLDHAASVIAACHELGVRVAVDDFGVGYASLTYLKRLPVDILKIDQSFVRDVLDDADDMALVEAVITLAKLFGRSVVAEGVEVAEQGVLLMRLGCDITQGYGIARPMAAAEVPAWAATWQPDPSWALWADTRWDMSDFPLLVAQYDHLRWVKRVLGVLEGKHLGLSQEELVDHRQCRLGHWYDHYGKRRYGHLPAYQEMYPVHAEVHRTGQEIVRLHAAGEMEAAHQKAQELLALKDQILDYLGRLQREVAREATADTTPT